MTDELRMDLPVAVLDTSGLLDYLVSAGNRKRRMAFDQVLADRLGPDPQYCYHPITLAELATNIHEEVLQSRQREGGLPSARRLQEQATLHRRALEVLEKSMRGQWGEVVPFRVVPVAPPLGTYLRLSRQRADYRNLRCLRKSGVVPVATLVDHQILALAYTLRQNGHEVVFISGDRELLGGAAGLDLAWIDSKNPERREPLRWKDCAEDGRCVSGCTDGVSACDRMFTPSPAEKELRTKAGSSPTT